MSLGAQRGPSSNAPSDPALAANHETLSYALSNSRGTDQPVWVRKLIWAFPVQISLTFLTCGFRFNLFHELMTLDGVVVARADNPGID